jgi:hypothetical protein
MITDGDLERIGEGESGRGRGPLQYTILESSCIDSESQISVMIFGSLAETRTKYGLNRKLGPCSVSNIKHVILQQKEIKQGLFSVDLTFHWVFRFN